MNSQRRYPSSKCARAYRSMTPGGPRGCAERRSGPDRGCWRRARTQPRRRRRGGRLCRFLLSTPTAFSDAPPADLSPQTRRWREMDSNFQSPKGRPDKQRRQPSTQFLCGDRAPEFARLAAGGTRFEPLGPRREWRVPCPLISRHEWILSAVRATFSIAGNQRETRVTSP
jgi:hypothetical protein